MRIDRFFIPLPLSTGIIRVEDEKIIHQMKHVLRMKPGTIIFLFNGDGNEWQASVETLANDFCSLAVEKKLVRDVEPPRAIHAGIAVLKKENFELVMQKLTEIGVTEITPIISDRTVKTGVSDERIKKIIVEAAEQSGRLVIPIVNTPKTPREFIAENEKIALFHMDGIEIGAYTVQPNTAFLVGPEGGWSDEELVLFTKHALPFVRLGKTTLRAETAAMIGAHYLVWK